ncbi:MAG: type I 3-dehydroquinate dehydratase [Pseudobutyrivibrio sp.]|nr:type I 3-dehydroquinate dehydratase [Pseudobutyrivibrio sp.]
MKSIQIRNITIGTGTPKICVPIIGKTRDEILQSASDINSTKHDLVEWRVDWYKDVLNPASVSEVLSQLRNILGDTPILFTFRTKAEGGELEISKEEYLKLNLDAIKNNYIDLVDVELFTGDDLVNTVIEEAHKLDIKVVVSSHDFERTPAKKELLTRLQRMQNLGADIPKLAVMPVDKADVITLLSATEEMNTNYADRPIVTMSMDKIGVISRICGELFGSSITFGSASGASAPGQIPADELYELINQLHKYFKKN